MKTIILFFFLIVHLNGLSQVAVFPYREGYNLWGAVDSNLKEVIEPSYTRMDFFIHHESDAAVAIVTDMSGYKALVNRKGEMLLEPEYTDLTYTDDEQGVVLYQTYPDKRYGLYSIPKKKIVINPMYEEAPSSLHLEANSLLVVKQGGKYGVIRSDGTMVVPVKYARIEPFSVEGCPWITARNENAVAYYNCKGAMRTEKPTTRPLSADLELISIGGERPVEGERQIEMNAVTPELVKQKLGEKAAIISKFQNGAGEHFAIVQVNNKTGMLDGKGVIRVPVEYDEIKNARGIGGFSAIKNGLEGWIDIAPGKVVIEAAFKKLYVPYYTFGRVNAAFRYVVGVKPDGSEVFIELKTGKIFYPKGK
jgi:hypothetical protein